MACESGRSAQVSLHLFAHDRDQASRERLVRIAIEARDEVALPHGLEVALDPRVVLQALRRYGMILADNGSPWYVTGAPSVGWNDDDLRDLHRITGADFEVVDTGAPS